MSATASTAPAPTRRDRSHYLYLAVIVAVLLGIAVGFIAPDFATSLKPIGEAFVALIKMMISPVIFCTIVLGVGSVRSAAHVGKVGGLALGYFLVMSTIALTIGLVVGNVFATFRWFSVFAAGIDTYELFLKIGIALLGVRFVFGDILKLGGLSLVLIALEFAIAGALMVWLGRRFGLGPKLTALLAVGSSICGVSAIIAAQGSIDER